MTFNKIAVSGLLTLVLASGAGVASAQVIAQPIFAPVCVTPTYNLRIGSTDAATNGSVTSLQNFLVSQGYFNAAYLGTGRFGPITYSAVASFQAAHGISAIGQVGPLTRALIGQINCGSTIPPVPPTNSPVSLYSLSPSVAVVGTTVSITGAGLTSNNTVLFNGLVAARNVPANSFAIPVACNPYASACGGGAQQTITFTIPSTIAPNCAASQICAQYLALVSPGQYNVTVQNANGTSNSLVLTINTGTSAQPLSINGLDAPSTLALGQQGTWTVRVLAGSGTGNLHYSVVWGDEAFNANSSIMAPQPTSTQTSASFTHAYPRSGTYTPTFTVTDDNGHSVSATATVLVTPLY